ncbi:glutathione S-transferase N-terminal domain-containing protein [Caviibacterium pharyngocola]|uniref:Glutathione S-transferase n=1 Tax=Caviibacterium pharyngocola TaxID=28159 RepID=A0A2M8RUC9_9PAST|nr:glutathione S-transferase N-terminal domain-containing protein [Caviibacterium pharyngocola]PJG82498.1 glutathione S-transferase [Caviibacterium pharyngocola]
MKLWYSTTSPFVRKVRAVAHYHHLQDQIELLLVTRAFSADSPHNQDTPLGRVPALQLDNGEWLYNSQIIAEYLDAIGTQPTLFPQGESRWQVLNLYALAEGVLENLVGLVLPERMFRPENEWWVGRHQQIMQRNDRTLTLIAQTLKQFGTKLNIGTLYTVCMIDFLLFRANVTGAAEYAAMDELRQWSEEMNRLYPCLQATKPVMPPQ